MCPVSCVRRVLSGGCRKFGKWINMYGWIMQCVVLFTSHCITLKLTVTHLACTDNINGKVHNTKLCVIIQNFCVLSK